MATALIDSMSDEWNPEDYVDEYKDALEKVIEDKIEKGDQPAPKHVHKVKPTNVIDLVSVLQKSLDQSGAGKRGKKTARSSTKTRRKAA
jgi:DNA end-binding protein Ku